MGVSVGGADVPVTGGGIGVRVRVARGTLVCAVKVMSTNGVAVLVRVTVGVRVGVKVGSGVCDAVGVGTVDVGNGPKSARDVSATAVRVRIAFWCACAESGCAREISVFAARINTIRISTTKNTCKNTRFSLRKLRFNLAALLSGTLPESVAELALVLTRLIGLTMQGQGGYGHYLISLPDSVCVGWCGWG